VVPAGLAGELRRCASVGRGGARPGLVRGAHGTFANFFRYKIRKAHVLLALMLLIPFLFPHASPAVSRRQRRKETQRFHSNHWHPSIMLPQTSPVQRFRVGVVLVVPGPRTTDRRRHIMRTPMLSMLCAVQQMPGIPTYGCA